MEASLSTMDKYDIIFDFSASRVGGGLRRLREYYRYFITKNYPVLFLVHPMLAHELKPAGKVEILGLARSPLGRIIADSAYVRPYAGMSPWFFSYGIPLGGRVADRNWFHVSNALPFGYRNCTVTQQARLKNWLLASRFKRGAKNVDVLSAESQFSLDLYGSTCCLPDKSLILSNGTELALGTGETPKVRRPYAITVGTEPYKRLDLVYEEYKAIKRSFGLERLEIIGNREKVPGAILHKDDVAVTGFLSDEEYLTRYREAALFISASEIENSSNAVLEAIQAGMVCRLSCIPSHLEMFREGVIELKNTDRFFTADLSMIRPECFKTWSMIIDEMCCAMGL